MPSNRKDFIFLHIKCFLRVGTTRISPYRSSLPAGRQVPRLVFLAKNRPRIYLCRHKKLRRESKLTVSVPSLDTFVAQKLKSMLNEASILGRKRPSASSPRQSPLRSLLSGRRESNSDRTLPKRIYYHYTTPRFTSENKAYHRYLKQPKITKLYPPIF